MKEGWKYCKLGEVGTFIRGGNFSKKDFIEDGYPCIHYGQIHTKFGIETSVHLSSVSEDIVKKERCAKKGDLVIAITSEDDAGSCKCTAWMADYDAYVGGHAAIYRHTLEPKYVSYYFRSSQFQKEKLQYTHGFKVVEISPKDIAKIDIPVPPLSAQQSIVTYLDTSFSLIDSLAENAKKALENAKALFQAELKKLMEKKEGWEEKKLGECCRLLRGSSPRPIKKFITNSIDGVNWIKIGDTQVGEKYIYGTKEKITKEGAEHSRFVEEGDFILSNSMSFGRPYIMKTTGCIHDGWFVIKEYQKHFSTDMFYYVLISPVVTKQFYTNATGSTVQNICSDIVNNVLLPIPPLSEQQKIVQTLDTLSQYISQLEQNYNKTLDDCQALKQALLRETFE